MTGLAEELPWTAITAKVLEELTFAILEEMGAATVDWRSSDKITTSDGGRDIEAVFHRPTPDDDIERQHWWLECKRRSDTVSPTAVKESVLNSTAYQHVSILIIVTNSFFSNPTKDWIAEHNRSGRGPYVKLWDRRRLQSLVEKYPSAAARSLVAALEFAERVDYLASYFFEKGRTLNELELRDAWANRAELDNVNFLIAAAYADICSSNIHRRPWMTTASPQALAVALVIAITNLTVMWARGKRVAFDKVVDTIAYIVGCAAVSLPADLVAEILDDPWSLIEGVSVPPGDHVWKPILDPIKYSLGNELELQCATDCSRYHRTGKDPANVKFFWEKYDRKAPAPSREEENELFVTDLTRPCAIGLEVTNEIICPLSAPSYVEPNERFVDMVGRVIRFRIKNPDGQFLKYMRPVIRNDVMPYVESLLERVGLPVGERLERPDGEELRPAQDEQYGPPV